MVAILKKEQRDDDHMKEYCAEQLDLSDDKKKALERSISDADMAIAAAKDGITTLTDEIAALKASIAALDKSVVEATTQRKDEHVAFNALMEQDAAAKELLEVAKNRLNKFYNPKLYKPENGAVLADVSAHNQRNDIALPPPPETMGPYTTKSRMNAGVIDMINILIDDLAKDMTAAETTEKDAQADYAAAMMDAAAKRTKDSQSLTDKAVAKGELENELEAHKGEKTSLTRELGGTLKYIASLHAECDWLLKYFDARAEARASEAQNKTDLMKNTANSTAAKSAAAKSTAANSTA